MALKGAIPRSRNECCNQVMKKAAAKTTRKKSTPRAKPIDSVEARLLSS